MARDLQLIASMQRPSLTCAALLTSVAGLAGCNDEPGARQIAPMLPAVAPAVSSLVVEQRAPALQGIFRWDATAALNDKARNELGAERTYVLDALRGADTEADALVNARVSWTFHQAQVSARFEGIYMLGNGEYRWQRCEASGAGAWNGEALSIATPIATTSAVGDAGKRERGKVECSASIAAGDYRVAHRAGELMLETSRNGALLGFVLTRDETEWALENETSQLAGFEPEATASHR